MSDRHRLPLEAQPPVTGAGGDGPGARQAAVWRVLVIGQLSVGALILLSLLAVFLMGLFGSLFAQHVV